MATAGSSCQSYHEQRWNNVMERILIALDGSSHSEKALDLAADLAEANDAGLLVVHVLSSAPLSDAERDLAAAEYVDDLTAWTTRLEPAGGGVEQSGHDLLMQYGDLARYFREMVGKRLIASAKAKLKGRKLSDLQTMLADGDPAQSILHLAKERGVDTIVMGSRGLSDIKGLFVGSVSHKINHLAECTCITVK
jgi:nucleotide-binding universal stress UspA family protein